MKKVTKIKYLHDMIDKTSLPNVITNLKELMNEIISKDGNPEEAIVNLPINDLPYIEFTRLENQKERSSRLKKEQIQINKELKELERLKAKYGSSPQNPAD